MRLLDCLNFALTDLKFKYRNTIRTILCFCLLQFMIIVWILITLVLPRMNTNASKAMEASKYLIAYADLTETGEINEKSEGWILRNYLCDRKYIGIDNPMINMVDLVQYAEQEDRWKFVNCDWLEITVRQDDESLSFTGSDSSNMEFIAVACGSKDFYSSNEYSVYLNDFEDPYTNAMIYGSPELSEKDLILPDIILKTIVNDESVWPELIGKKISISCEGITLFEDYTLKGIYDYRLYYDLDSEEYGLTATDFQYPVYFRCDYSDLTKYGIDGYNLIFYCNSDVNYETVCEDVTKAGFKNVMINDEGLFSVYEEKVITSAEKIINELLYSLGAVISVAVLFYLVTTVYVEKKNKSGYVGILHALGMNNKNTVQVTCIQQFFISIGAVIPSFILSGVVMIILNHILNFAIGLSLNISVFDFLIAVIAAISFTVVIGLLLYLPMMISYGRKSAAELMQV